MDESPGHLLQRCLKIMLFRQHIESAPSLVVLGYESFLLIIVGHGWCVAGSVIGLPPVAKVEVEAALHASKELEGDGQEEGGEASEEEGKGCANMEDGGEKTGVDGVPIEEHLLSSLLADGFTCEGKLEVLTESLQPLSPPICIPIDAFAFAVDVAISMAVVVVEADICIAAVATLPAAVVIVAITMVELVISIMVMSTAIQLGDLAAKTVQILRLWNSRIAQSC